MRREARPFKGTLQMSGSRLLATHAAPAAGRQRPKRSGDLPMQHLPHRWPVSGFHLWIVRQLHEASCLPKESATTTYVRTSPARCRTNDSPFPTPN